MSMEILAKAVLTAMVIRETSDKIGSRKTLIQSTIEAFRIMENIYEHSEHTDNDVLLVSIILQDWNNAEIWAKNVLGL